LRVYLDLCCFNRPFDDQGQPRIYLETQALVLLLEKVALGKHILCVSAALDVENNQNPNQERRRNVGELFKQAQDWIPHRKELDQRVNQLLTLGFRTFDAYHVASAEAGGCDRLVTCDDQFLKASRGAATEIRVTVTDPTSFVSEAGF